MNWQQQWIDSILTEIPMGGYRSRVEAELHDHLEMQYCALTEAGWTAEQARAEALRAMGEPEALRTEYQAAWRRSRPARAEERRRRLGALAGGLAVMCGAHLLVTVVLSSLWQMAISLPGNSNDKWVRLIRRTLGNLNNTYLIRWLPLVFALAAGAFWLGRRFRASSHPAPLISAGLCVHWAYIAAFNGLWRGLVNHHRPFWEAVGRHFYFMGWHYAWTFALCILLGMVSGHISAKIRTRKSIFGM